MYHRVWITWERQRRSLELSSALGCKLFVLEHKGLYRYLRCIFSTVKIVHRERPKCLFVQNPSMVLACLAVLFLRFFYRPFIIVDRHSNFMLNNKSRFSIYELFFRILSMVTIRLADLTIVTNEELSNHIELEGGKPFVLPDKIPCINAINQNNCNSPSVLFISSFASDEPISTIWDAAEILKASNITFYVSGNTNKLNKALYKKKPTNIILTGYLPDQNYIDLLFCVDICIILTRSEYTLLCGCYEAIAAGRPFITSNTKVLQHLFKEAFFVENNAESIVDGIKNILENPKTYRLKVLNMLDVLNKSWTVKFSELNRFIDSLVES